MTSICEAKDVYISVSAEPAEIENPTLVAPSFAFTEQPFTVTGETPEANQRVWIELDKEYLFDEVYAEGQSDSNRQFEIELQLSEVGINKIHSEIETGIPNKTSPSRSIVTLNYILVGVIILAIVLVVWKGGVFKKGTKRRKK